ncbi:MAG: hypothetical protein WCX65_10705 [bacterium]
MKSYLISILLFSLMVLCRPCFGAANPWNIPPAMVFSSYHFDPDKPLADRVTQAPAFVLDFLSRFNTVYLKNNGLKYSAYSPTPAELTEINKYIDALPKGFRDKIAPHLLGIYFVNNFLVSGITHYVRGEDNKLYFFIVLSSDDLKLSASEWITKKERSCFIPDPAYELEISIGDGGASGFHYIFYHEIMHGYEYVERIMPGEGLFFNGNKSMAHEMNANNAAIEYQYIDPFWIQYDKPVKKFDFPSRDKITFYGLKNGPLIKMSDAPDIYKNLVESPFVSLYGSMDLSQDLAEYSAMYMHVKVLKLPWTLTIRKNGETIFVMKDLLDRENVKNRAEFIADIYK